MVQLSELLPDLPTVFNAGFDSSSIFALIVSAKG